MRRLSILIVAAIILLRWYYEKDRAFQLEAMPTSEQQYIESKSVMTGEASGLDITLEEVIVVIEEEMNKEIILPSNLPETGTSI